MSDNPRTLEDALIVHNLRMLPIGDACFGLFTPDIATSVGKGTVKDIWQFIYALEDALATSDPRASSHEEHDPAVGLAIAPVVLLRPLEVPE